MKQKEPIKKLVVTRETVKDLTVRSHVQTGIVPIHSLSITTTTSLSHSVTSHSSFSI